MSILHFIIRNVYICKMYWASSHPVWELDRSGARYHIYLKNKSPERDSREKKYHIVKWLLLADRIMGGFSLLLYTYMFFKLSELRFLWNWQTNRQTIKYSLTFTTVPGRESSLAAEPSQNLEFRSVSVHGSVSEPLAATATDYKGFINTWISSNLKKHEIRTFW